MKRYLDWIDINSNWIDVNINWEDIFILIGGSNYIKDNPWDKPWNKPWWINLTEDEKKKEITIYRKLNSI